LSGVLKKIFGKERSNLNWPSVLWEKFKTKQGGYLVVVTRAGFIVVIMLITRISF
jgi:hypothetical protein